MKNETNCIIIHGCPSGPEEFININDPESYPKHWIPYIKKGLISAGVITETPLMHYILKHMVTEKFPELLEEVLKIK
jgi:hypothetical protein